MSRGGFVVGCGLALWHGSTHFDAGRAMLGCGPKKNGPVWPAHGARVGALMGWIRVRFSKTPIRIRLTAKSETWIRIWRLWKFISKLEPESHYQIRNPNLNPYPNPMDFQNSYPNSNRNLTTKSKTWFWFRIRIWWILKIHIQNWIRPKIRNKKKSEPDAVNSFYHISKYITLNLNFFKIKFK